MVLWIADLQYRSKVSWQSVASLDSRLDSRFLRESRTFHRESRTCYRESRTFNRESSRGSSLARLKAKTLPRLISRFYVERAKRTASGYTSVARADVCFKARKEQVNWWKVCLKVFPLIHFQMPAPNAKNIYIYIYSLMFAFSTIWIRSGKTYRKRPHEYSIKQDFVGLVVISPLPRQQCHCYSILGNGQNAPLCYLTRKHSVNTLGGCP